MKTKRGWGATSQQSTSKNAKYVRIDWVATGENHLQFSLASKLGAIGD